MAYQDLHYVHEVNMVNIVAKTWIYCNTDFYGANLWSSQMVTSLQLLPLPLKILQEHARTNTTNESL